MLSRRRFLGAAAALGAAVAFPAVRIGRALDTPLRNVVVLMRENRSFDHYFGRFPGADGLPAGAPVTAAAAACVPDPPHDEEAFVSLSQGSGFAGSALTVFSERDVPTAWALARRFTLCDRYFASVLGPTFANRLFSIAASAGGYHDNPTRIDPALLPRPSLVDRLEAAGVDWACYLAGSPDARYNPVAYYPEHEGDPRASRSFRDFLRDAAAGTLPPVSWVVPQDPLTEHPPSPPHWGQRLAALAVNAVASGPQWATSAMVLNYDESGGFFDHVPPPRVGPSNYGFRVPCTIVSPYARAGHVSHVTYDHASVLALVERTFGLAPLTERDAAASPFTDCFDFDRPNSDPVVFPAAGPPAGCQAAPAWASELLALPLPAATVPRLPEADRTGELALGLGGLAAALAGGGAVGLAWRARGARS